MSGPRSNYMNRWVYRVLLESETFSVLSGYGVSL